MRHWLAGFFRNGAPAYPASTEIFASIDAAPLVETPYPHLVVEPALPRVIADTLLAEMPPLEVFTQGRSPASNVRFPLPSPIALQSPKVSEIWKSALRTCLDASEDFLNRTLARLGPRLLAVFPDFESRFGPIHKLRAVPRYGPRARNEVGMDAQIVVNSPPLAAGTSVRGPHLDLPDKLISALLYLRPQRDDSAGGELQLYEPVGDTLYFTEDNNAASAGMVRHIRTYPYRHNLMVLPVATPLGIHGVSPRARTRWPRYHLHIVGEMSEPLFDIPRARPAPTA